MKGYKTYRHKDNPKEKEFHDKFTLQYFQVPKESMDLIVFGQSNKPPIRPNDYLTERERKIVISTIQWLGSSVGQSFLRECGFEQIKLKQLWKQ